MMAFLDVGKCGKGRVSGGEKKVWGGTLTYLLVPAWDLHQRSGRTASLPEYR